MQVYAWNRLPAIATLLALLSVRADAFAPLPPSTATSSGYSSSLQAYVSYSKVKRIGYELEVNKPLGIIFGENDAPFNGLAVVEVDPDQNGAEAGIRVGDQLLAVNKKSTVGEGFDTAMGMLRDGSDPLELQLYRGTVRQLFTILKNVVGDDEDLMEEDDEEEDDDEDNEVVVMDENYESPVKVPVDTEDEKPISAGDVLNVFKKLTEKKESTESTDGEKKKKGGLFGSMFSKDTIQLEGEDAGSTK
jgi:hypothetical protein